MLLDQCREVQLKLCILYRLSSWRMQYHFVQWTAVGKLCVNLLSGCVVRQCSENILPKNVLFKNLFKSVSGFVLVIAGVSCKYYFGMWFLDPCYPNSMFLSSALVLKEAEALFLAISCCLWWSKVIVFSAVGQLCLFPPSCLCNWGSKSELISKTARFEQSLMTFFSRLRCQKLDFQKKD